MTAPDSLPNIGRFIRPDLVALGAYGTHKAPETLEGVIDVPVEGIIKLDANENPYGCSPGVQQALAEYPKFNIYPDAGQTRLRQQLAQYTGIDAAFILAANGSGELLDDLLCLLLEPSDEVINCIPTFDMYRVRTAINRGKLVNVPRDENYAVDVRAVKAAITPKTRIIILANPNNPTGNVTPRKDILELADTGVPLLVDEAYYEFCGETVAPLVKQYSNLMVLRTLSKWAGLAGLRIGYGILPPEIVSYLMKIKLPYNVNVAVLVAVEATMKDMDYLKKGIRAIIAERQRLLDELRKVKWLKPLPSAGNFIFCSVLKGSARELHQRLQDRGILVRYIDQSLLQNSIRISVGKPEHTDALIKVLRKLEKAND